MHNVAIIGAGLTGAAAAFELRRLGFDPVVFEATDRVGGRVESVYSNGYVSHTGASFFTSHFYPRLFDYLDTLDLNDRLLQQAQQITVVAGDERFYFDANRPRSVLFSKLLSPSEKLRLLWHSFKLSNRAQPLDLSDPQSLTAYDWETIESYVSRTLGRNAYERLFRLAIESCWFFSCSEASAALAQALLAGAFRMNYYTLRGGIELLAERLLQDVPLQFNRPIQRIEAAPMGGILLYSDSSEQHFDAVVVTCPAPAAAAILGPSAAALLTAEQLHYLQTQIYAASITLSFVVDQPLLISETMLPVARERIASLALEPHGEVTLVNVYLLHAASKSLLNESDADIAATVWRDVRALALGLPQQFGQLLHVTRRPAAIPLHSVGRYGQAADFWQQQQQPLLFAGDYLTVGTLEGALAAGQRVARRLHNVTSSANSDDLQRLLDWN